MEDKVMLYSFNYFLWHNIEEFSYEAYNFISLASDLGGLLEALFLFLSVVPYYWWNPIVTEKKFL